MRSLFPRVVGHARAKSALAQGLATGRLTGALLLCGPEGSGRRTLAREVAKAVNCKGPEDGPLPCNACGPCGRIERGSYGDYNVVAPDGQSIGIEQVKDLLVEMAKAPVEARVRVFVVAPAGAMTEDAQNAFLKGLEEPSERSLVVLVAAREDELLPTVGSRCRVVRLGELAQDEVLEVLRRAGVADAEAPERARWCGGSPGRALSDEALALAKLANGAADALASGVAYADPLGTVDRLSPDIDAGGADAPLKRARLGALLRAVGRTLRDALVLRATGAAPVAPLSGATVDLLAPLARTAPGRLEEAIDHLVRLEEELEQSVNPALVLEGMVLDVGGALAPRAAQSTAGGRRGG